MVYAPPMAALAGRSTSKDAHGIDAASWDVLQIAWNTNNGVTNNGLRCLKTSTMRATFWVPMKMAKQRAARPQCSGIHSTDKIESHESQPLEILLSALLNLSASLECWAKVPPMEARFDFLIEIESIRIRNSKISPWKSYAVWIWIWIWILIQHFSLERPIVQGIHDCCRKLQFVLFLRTAWKPFSQS